MELADAEETSESSRLFSRFSWTSAVYQDVEIIADHAVKAIVNGVCGANEEDYHYHQCKS